MRTGVNLAIVVLLLSPACLCAEEYPIKLDRLPKVGSVIEVTSETEQSGDVKYALVGSNHLGARAGVTGAYKTTASLVIQITIDEVDAAGWTTKATYKLIHWDVTNADALSAGRKTAADLKGKAFTVSVSEGKRQYLEPTGTPGEYFVLEDFKASILDLAVPMRFFKGEPGLDAMFGPPAPQKSGGAWDANAPAVAESFANLGVTKDHIQGTTTLKEAGLGAAAKMLKVESTATMTGLSYKNSRLHENGYTLADDKFEMSVATSIPADESALPAEQTIKFSASVNGAAKGGKVTEWTKESGQARYKLLK